MQWRRSRKLVFSNCARQRPGRRAGPIVRPPQFRPEWADEGGPSTRALSIGRTSTPKGGGRLRHADPTQRNDRMLPPRSPPCQKCSVTCGFGARGGIRTLDLPITRRMLGVGLDGSRRIEPAHVGWLVGPDGYRRIVWMIKRMIKGCPTESDAKASKGVPRLTNDQGASDTKSDAKASNHLL
jgi:hypothetical protein